MMHTVPSGFGPHWGEGNVGVQARSQMSMQFSLYIQCQVPYVSAWFAVPVVTMAFAAGSGTPDGPQALNIVAASAPTSAYFIMMVFLSVRRWTPCPPLGDGCL